MPSSTENPSPFDPTDRMPADEPRFMLRAKDPATPASITEWARVTRMLAAKEFGIQPTNERDKAALTAVLLKCREAEKQAFEMDEWRKGQEPISGELAKYNEQQQTFGQLAALEQRRRADALLRHIQEGRYHLSEARDGFLDLGLITQEQADRMSGWLEAAQQIHEHADPRREFHEPQLPIAGKD